MDGLISTLTSEHRVAVKIATLQDIENITTFAKYYKDVKKLFPDSEFKEADFKAFLLECLRTRGTKIFISEHDGEVRGFLIMSIDTVPWNKSRKWASDILFAAERDAHKLINTGIAWASKFNCWKIFFSNSTGISQADRFYKLIGLKYTGGQYEYVP